MDYFGIRSKEIERIRGLDLETDIVHFREMTVDTIHAEEIQRRVDQVLFSQTPPAKARVAELTQKVRQMEMDLAEANQAMEGEGID